MKRDIEQVWFYDRLPHVADWFAGIKYLGPEVFPGLWAGTIDTELREIAFKLKLKGAWKTYRVPLEFVVLYRGKPTQAKPGGPASED